MSHHLSLLFVGVLFLGCSSKMTEVSTKSFDDSSNVTQHEKTIEGSYDLQEGIYYYGTSSSATGAPITDSKLFIEKLDDNDYGYYVTVQVQDLSSKEPSKIFHTEKSGIFHKEGDKFFDRIIYSKNMTKDSNETKDVKNPDDVEKDLTTEILRKNEIEISPSEEGIKIVMKIGEAKADISWNRVEADSPVFQTQEVEEAKKDYNETYRERFMKFYKDMD